MGNGGESDNMTKAEYTRTSPGVKGVSACYRISIVERQRRRPVMSRSVRLDTALTSRTSPLSLHC